MGNGRRSSFESDASESICVVGDDVISEFGDNYSFYNHPNSNQYRDELLERSLIQPRSDSVNSNNTFVADSAVENEQTGSLQKKESEITNKIEEKGAEMSDSIFVGNQCEPSTLIDMDSSTEPSGSNMVEFYSNMNLTEDDLDDILLYLESKRKSGGGDTSQSELDKTGRFVLVNYLSYLSKQRVLEKRIHEFRNYTLIANEPFNKDKFLVDNSVIIFKIDASKVDEECLKMYSENAVINDDESNDVEWIKQSQLLKNIFYVKYKLDFDYAKLKERLAKKPKLNRAQVDHERAYTTNAIVVKHFNQEKIRDMIELYFSSKKRCGVDFYSMIQIRGEHSFIFYNKSSDVETILSKSHKIGELEINVEYLYNFDLFEKENVQRIEGSTMTSSDSSSSKFFEGPISSSASGVNSDVNKMNPETKALAAPQEKQQPVEEPVQVKAQDETLDQTKSTSDSAKGEIESKKEENVSETKTDSTQERNQVDDLSRMLVDNSRIQEENTSEPEQSQQSTSELENTSEPSTEVKELKSVNSMTDTSQPIFIVLDVQQESKLRLFIHFAKLYQEFQRELEGFDAKCSESNKSDDFSSIKIQYALQLPASEENYVNLKKEWTQKVMCFLNDWFDKFEIKIIETQRSFKTLNELTDALNIDAAREKIIQMNDNTFELLGFKTRVAELERQINEQQNDRTINDQLIDLELFQVRMLYIKFVPQIKQQYPDLKVAINKQANKHLVEFEGKESEVTQAKQTAQDLLKSIQKFAIPVDELLVAFIATKMKKIVEWLKDFDFECVLVPDKETKTLQIYSTDKHLLKTIHARIKEAIKIVEIDQSLIEYLEATKMARFIEKLKNNPEIMHDYDGNKIKICGFDEQTSKVYQDFLENMQNDI